MVMKKLRAARAGLAIVALAAGLVAVPGAAKAPAQLGGVLGGAGVGGPVTRLLGGASDKALDKLAVPGTFYADTAIRILLPGAGGKALSSVFKAADKLGVTAGLTRSMNDAAGLAAKEAKPVFRAAIDGLSLQDVPGIATQRDGATQYLQRTSGEVLRTKMRPLFEAALTKVGAFKLLDKLPKLNTGSLGQLGNLGGLGGLALNRDTLTDSVTDQAMKGIYTYMAREEAGLRANPLGAAKDVLGGILK